MRSFRPGKEVRPGLTPSVVVIQEGETPKGPSCEAPTHQPPVPRTRSSAEGQVRLRGVDCDHAPGATVYDTGTSLVGETPTHGGRLCVRVQTPLRRVGSVRGGHSTDEPLFLTSGSDPHAKRLLPQTRESQGLQSPLPPRPSVPYPGFGPRLGVGRPLGASVLESSDTRGPFKDPRTFP